MLHRILEILNAKIAMGAGYRRKRLGGCVMAGESEGYGYRRKRMSRAGEGIRHHKRVHHKAGVMAGEGMRHRKRVHHKAGVMAGEGVRHRHKRAGVSAGTKHESAWIKHVKHYAKVHGISYREALSEASKSYHNKY